MQDNPVAFYSLLTSNGLNIQSLTFDGKGCGGLMNLHVSTEKAHIGCYSMDYGFHFGPFRDIPHNPFQFWIHLYIL